VLGVLEKVAAAFGGVEKMTDELVARVESKLRERDKVKP